MNDIFKSYEYSLLLEHQELMNLFDIDSFKRNCKAMMEGVIDSTAITNTIIETEREKISSFINRSLDTLRNVSIDKTKVEDFFSKTYNSTLLTDMPLATEVADISEVEKIRPQYLEQVSTDMVTVIDKIFKGTIENGEIKNFCNDDYSTKLKRQLVRTSIPIAIKPVDMANISSKTIVQINNEFLTTNVLPFLRSLPQLTKEMEATSINAISQINTLFSSVKSYITTAEKLKVDQSCDIKMRKKLDYYLYNISRIIFDNCTYIAAMIIRRVNAITFNIIAYNDLYEKILNYYPEGERVIHESILDGSFKDIDDGVVVHNILNGDASTLYEICNTLVRKQRSDLSYLSGSEIGDDFHSKIDSELNEYEYSITPYHNSIQILHQISDSIDILFENAKDEEMVFDDIIKKAALDTSLSVRFKEIIPTISDVENYHSVLAQSSDDKSMETVIMTILKELQDFNQNINGIVSLISGCYKKISAVKYAFKDNINLEFHNQATLNELIGFISEFEVDYRQFILTLVHSLISRLEGLSHILNEFDKNILDDSTKKIQFSQIEKMKDDSDYYEEAIENIFEENALVTQHVFESMLKEYDMLRALKDRGVKLVYEADETSAKVEVTSNAQQEQNNQNTVNNTADNTQNKTGVAKQTVQDIVTSIKTFFANMLKKFRDKVTEQKNPNGKSNLTWIATNKEALLNRGYQGINVWVLPYNNVSPDSVINEVNGITKKVNMLTSNSVAKFAKKDDLKIFLFGDILGENINKSLNESMTQHYKTGKSPLKTVVLKNAQLKTEIPNMITYCENYYNSYAENVAKALESLGNATETRVNGLSVMTESVLMEAPSDTKTVTVTGNGSKTNGNVNITKAQWLSTIVQEYSGIVLNCIRDRNFDYLKILGGLIPAKTNAAKKKNEEKPEENTEGQ